MIHPTALVDPKARLADDVEVGPFSIIGPDVTIGAGSVIGPHVVVKGPTTLGERTARHHLIHAGIAVGSISFMWAVFTFGLRVMLPPGEILRIW